MNECTIILLGATGDLAKRKLIPALCTLINAKRLTRFLLVGVAFEDVTVDELKALDLPIYKYKLGSKGPVECDMFAEKHGMRWKS